MRELIGRLSLGAMYVPSCYVVFFCSTVLILAFESADVGFCIVGSNAERKEQHAALLGSDQHGGL